MDMARPPMALKPSSNFSPYPSLLPQILSMAPSSMKIIMISMTTELMEMPPIQEEMLSVKILASAAAISSL